MKKKRFIKLLMAHRVPRNLANQLAERAQALGVSYFKALGDFLTLASVRVINYWEGRVVWQAPATNCWLEVLAGE